MQNEATILLSDVVREAAHPLFGGADDYDPLLQMIGDAHLVLIGEASHGTHEFYRERAQITKRLIKEKGFTAVAVEADWPDAYRVNRYVRGASADADAVEALAGFKRFPAWMWRNADVLDFVGWLRTHNDDLPGNAVKTGFYGLDLYSLHTSIEAVLTYLDKVDPEAGRRARYRYACFDHFGKDEQTYGYATGLGIRESCEEEVISQLVDLRRQAAEFARRDGRIAADDYFYAEQNARLVMNAEKYYRSMFRGRVSSWNLRDQHMVETLEHLIKHLGDRSATSEDCDLGSQFAPRRRPRNAHGRRRRMERRPARAREAWTRRRAGWTHYRSRDRDRRFKLGRTRRAQAGAARVGEQLRGCLPRCEHVAFPLDLSR